MATVELSQRVRFHAVHNLIRDVATPEAEASRRTHGHDYEAEACIAGVVGTDGMLMDQCHLRQAIERVVREFEGYVIEDIGGLGPATTENMAVHLWNELHSVLPGLLWVAIGREVHGDRVVHRGG